MVSSLSDKHEPHGTKYEEKASGAGQGPHRTVWCRFLGTGLAFATIAEKSPCGVGGHCGPTNHSDMEQVQFET